MSDSQLPTESPLNVVPALPQRSAPRFSVVRFLGRLFLLMILGVSLALNFILFLALIGFGDRFGSSSLVTERYYAGQETATEKIAVVRLDGIITDSSIGFMLKELDRAATDSSVKAVVLRINSPGGSISASDELHRRITQLRDGNPLKKTSPKPIIVSMGSLAASGGYYIAMPAKTLIAERTTLTGSIGVYAALPNVTKLSDKIGFGMTVLKAGEVKDSGSPFREMTGHEKHLWQNMIDQAYVQFLHVVEEGRPQLTDKLQENIVIDDHLPVRGSSQEKFTRYRADGGIFTAPDAKKYGLIDQIGYLDDAVDAAKQAAKLGENYKVVTYERPPTLFGSLLGIKSRPPETVFDPNRLVEAAMPRLWYLAPQAEFAGMLAAMGQDDN
jgi:protease-4